MRQLGEPEVQRSIQAHPGVRLVDSVIASTGAHRASMEYTYARPI